MCLHRNIVYDETHTSFQNYPKINNSRLPTAVPRALVTDPSPVRVSPILVIDVWTAAANAPRGVTNGARPASSAASSALRAVTAAFSNILAYVLKSVST